MFQAKTVDFLLGVSTSSVSYADSFPNLGEGLSECKPFICSTKIKLVQNKKQSLKRR